ncbi:MAG TPA: zf-HC2 domain-containing protein [Gemmatimonadales bacterium]|nr:zf-HC2 domain-containing protein [Gemmatimonadales bacterium]
MSHLEEGILHALLDGEIPSAELPPLQAHLAGCAECRARLEAERGLLGEAAGLVELLELPAGAAVAPRRAPASAPWSRRLAWAASIVAALGLGYAGRGWRVSDEPSPVQAPARSNAAAPQPDSARELAKAQEPSADRPAPAPAAPQPTHASRRPAAAAAPPQKEPSNPVAEPRQAKVAAETRLEESVAAANRVDSGTARPATAVSAASERAAAPALGRLQDAGALKQLRGAPPPLLAPAEPISLPDAVRRLGGSLRLVEGLVPLRLEAQGQTVRVVYGVAQGELVLSQQLIDGRIVAVLSAPPGFPADSLSKLRARVRE